MGFKIIGFIICTFPCSTGFTFILEESYTGSGATVTHDVNNINNPKYFIVILFLYYLLLSVHCLPDQGKYKNPPVHPSDY